MADLSPAAQAVLDAAVCHPVFATHRRIAAALRAAADQVVPDDGVTSSIERIIEKRIRVKLLAIADELEAP